MNSVEEQYPSTVPNNTSIALHSLSAHISNIAKTGSETVKIYLSKKFDWLYILNLHIQDIAYGKEGE